MCNDALGREEPTTPERRQTMQDRAPISDLLGLHHVNMSILVHPMFSICSVLLLILFPSQDPIHVRRQFENQTQPQARYRLRFYPIYPC
jgi:hypothetical protein